MAHFGQEYTVGMPLKDARVRVIATSTRFQEYSTSDCAKAYKAQGGPCIVGLVETGSTWWGMEYAIGFRLYFDAMGTLQTVQVEPENSFL